MMEGSKQNFYLPQATPMKDGLHRPMHGIRLIKVSKPNRHNSFPGYARPTQIKSTNSFHVPATHNDYPPSMPPTPCNTPSYSPIDIDPHRHSWNDDNFQPNKICNNLEKDPQKFPAMRKIFIVRSRRVVGQNKDVDNEHSSNLSKSPDIIVKDPTLNTQPSKTSSPDTYNQSVDQLKNIPTKKK